MNINQIFIRFSLILLVVACFAVRQPAEARYAAIVVDANDGTVLHSINADTRNYPASLTKMMTLYMLFEALDQGTVVMHQEMIVSRKATRARPSKLGLGRGERIKVKDAIAALIAKSANDIAIVVAEELAGSVRAFAKAMTRRARELGMERTTFRNPHGLPNRGHLSTARDMAVLSRLLIERFPHYYDYFATKRFKFRGRKFTNHNKLLGRYSGADGIKTGYTHAAGYNLAASAERDGHRLIAVVFGGKTAKFRDRHVKKLLDKGFAKLGDAQSSEESPVDKPKAPATKIPHQISPEPFPDPHPAQSVAAEEARELARQIAAEAALPPFKNSAPAKAEPETLAAEETNSTDKSQVKKGTWMIQIGAYYKKAPAARRASKAAEKLSKVGKRFDVAVMTGERKNRTVYRARLAGLSRQDALDACRQLKRHKFDCIPMSPGRARGN